MLDKKELQNRFYNAATGKALKVATKEYVDRQRSLVNLRRKGYSAKDAKGAVNYLSYKDSPAKLRSALLDTTAVYTVPAAALTAGAVLIQNRKAKDLRYKSASVELDTMFFEKSAKADAPTRTRYLKDIDCDGCGYQGKPTNEGRCPECGAICGVSQAPKTAPKDLTIQEIEGIMGDVDSAYQKDQHDTWIRICGG